MVRRILRRFKRILYGSDTLPRRYRFNDELAAIAAKAELFRQKLQSIKDANPIDSADGFWYPYSILGNFWELDQTLSGGNRDLLRLIGERPVADIGGADGEIVFFLEQAGVKEVHLYESASLNCSHLRGANILKEQLHSGVQIHDIDLDGKQITPDVRFGLVFFLGTLYHLKNPFAVLEHLSKITEYCLLSTRIARCLPDGRSRIDSVPVAYLVGPEELNNDPSNYFIFSHTGLKRLCQRCGWEVLDWNTFDNRKNSTPTSFSEGERAFCLLKSIALPKLAHEDQLTENSG